MFGLSFVKIFLALSKSYLDGKGNIKLPKEQASFFHVFEASEDNCEVGAECENAITRRACLSLHVRFVPNSLPPPSPRAAVLQATNKGVAVK